MRGAHSSVAAFRKGSRIRARAAIACACLAAGMLSLLGVASSARANGVPFHTGDVLASVSDGLIKHFDSSGNLLDTLDTTLGTGTNGGGMCFDSQGNLYATEFAAETMSKFDPNGNLLAAHFGSGFNSDPESCAFSAADHVFTGQADGSQNVLEFDTSGSLLSTFAPAVENRGTDWVDLAKDQCTLYYTSEGNLLKAFNVCTNTQLADFASGLPGPCYAHRILADGTQLVACTSEVVRLDSSGKIAQTYQPGGSSLFALNLDPDGTSFWTADLLSDQIWRIDIATGNVLTTFNASAASGLVPGLAIVGEITAAQPTLDLAPPAQTQTVGSTASLTATLTLEGSPLSGKSILFSVGNVNTASGSGTTNGSGQASFSYRGTNAGTDTVTACYDANGNGVCDTGEQTVTATVTWNPTTTTPPTVVTGQASQIVQSTATLNGSVNPNGAAVSDCHFDWGLTSSYGHSVACTPMPGAGTRPVSVSGHLSGLVPGSTYHFRIVARNAAGTGTGSDQTFIAGGAPTVSSDTATASSSTTAVAAGNIESAGTTTTYFFQYGLDAQYREPGAAGIIYDQQTDAMTLPPNGVAVASLTGLVPNALYHVRLVAENGAGVAFGPDQTFMTFADPAPPKPTLGTTVNVRPVAGIVFIRPPRGRSLELARQAAAFFGPAILTKGQGFVPLTEARQIPAGSQIDARRGTLELVTASAAGAKTQSGKFSSGLFSIRQARRGFTKGLATLTLLENAFPGAPSFRSICGASASAASLPRAGAARLSARILQTLNARESHGRFRTRGRYSAATVRGTVWTTTDRCDGTLTKVSRGKVFVRDFRLRKTITLHAGQSYLARAIARRRR